jgi:hypothetical protein
LIEIWEEMVAVVTEQWGAIKLPPDTLSPFLVMHEAFREQLEPRATVERTENDPPTTESSFTESSFPISARNVDMDEPKNPFCFAEKADPEISVPHEEIFAPRRASALTEIPAEIFWSPVIETSFPTLRLFEIETPRVNEQPESMFETVIVGTAAFPAMERERPKKPDEDTDKFPPTVIPAKIEAQEPAKNEPDELTVPAS